MQNVADFVFALLLMSFRIPAAWSKGGEQIASSDGIASSHAYEIAVVSISFSQIRIMFEPQKINSRVDITPQCGSCISLSDWTIPI